VFSYVIKAIKLQEKEMKQNMFEGKLEKSTKKELNDLSVICKADILTMTTLAASGHPGGSMSSLDIYLVLYKFANININNLNDLDRDRIIISHGHTSPAVYSVLGRNNFFNIDEAIATFRLAGSIFEGHIERNVPGVEWTTGNLGQGLSAACGMALTAKVHNTNFDVFCIMGDGEQQKGQISEARRFAVKYKLNNITAFVDYNGLQISGNISNVMPQQIKENYLSDGWEVLEINGHDFDAIFNAIVQAKSIEKPVLILAKTIMGNGVSFMENVAGFHGKPLTEEQLEQALAELKVENKLNYYKEIREKFIYDPEKHKISKYNVNINEGSPIIYGINIKTDNRTAFGNAITDLVQNNPANSSETPIIVFDCDLAGSVKTDKVMKEFEHNFYQSGIQEHHTAVAAGALSINNTVTFFADFGVFGVDETYNQQRLTDINHGNLKVVTTHVGIDVGEDGRTHQCIDYLGVMRNCFGFKIIIPADPNQTDKAVRYAAANYGNFLIAMGRSKINVLYNNKTKKPFFDENYKFEYGKIDILKDGEIPLLTYGAMVPKSYAVYDLVKDKINLAILNVSCPNDLDADEEKLLSYLDKGIAFVYEDHNKNTGLGSTLAKFICERGLKVKLTTFGATNYAYSGKPDDVLNLMGISPVQIAKKIKEKI
jgi:transketolase